MGQSARRQLGFTSSGERLRPLWGLDAGCQHKPRRQHLLLVSVGGPLVELGAGFSGDAMQDVLIGGAIVSAVGAALFNGTKVRRLLLLQRQNRLLVLITRQYYQQDVSHKT